MDVESKLLPLPPLLALAPHSLHACLAAAAASQCVYCSAIDSPLVTEPHIATRLSAPASPILQGLYACSAGCHPAGSVIGCAGHNAAAALIRDLGLAQWWRTPVGQ